VRDGDFVSPVSPVWPPIANIMEISLSLGEADTFGPFMQVGTVAVVYVGKDAYPDAVVEVREWGSDEGFKDNWCG
jgi:hypothetical protein